MRLRRRGSKALSANEKARQLLSEEVSRRTAAINEQVEQAKAIINGFATRPRPNPEESTNGTG